MNMNLKWLETYSSPSTIKVYKRVLSGSLKLCGLKGSCRRMLKTYIQIFSRTLKSLGNGWNRKRSSALMIAWRKYSDIPVKITCIFRLL